MTTMAENWAEILRQGRTDELEKHIAKTAIDVAVDCGAILLFEDDSWIDMRADNPITGTREIM